MSINHILIKLAAISALFSQAICMENDEHFLKQKTRDATNQKQQALAIQYLKDSGHCYAAGRWIKQTTGLHPCDTVLCGLYNYEQIHHVKKQLQQKIKAGFYSEKLACEALLTDAKYHFASLKKLGLPNYPHPNWSTIDGYLNFSEAPNSESKRCLTIVKDLWKNSTDDQEATEIEKIEIKRIGSAIKQSILDERKLAQEILAAKSHLKCKPSKAWQIQKKNTGNQSLQDLANTHKNLEQEKKEILAALIELKEIHDLLEAKIADRQIVKKK